MSINRWMDKEDVLYIYNRILLSHKKEWNIAICRNMDGPGDYHTKWSQRKTNTIYHPYFGTVVLKTLESPLVSKEIKPVNPKGNQLWIFLGRTDTEAEAPIFWLPDAKSQLIRKDPDAGKDWRQKKGTTEDDMDGWHCRLNGCEFEQTPGDGEGQGRLVCCSPWGRKESDTTEWLSNN